MSDKINFKNLIASTKNRNLLKSDHNSEVSDSDDSNLETVETEEIGSITNNNSKKLKTNTSSNNYQITKKIIKKIETDIRRIKYKVWSLKGIKKRNCKKNILQYIISNDTIKRSREMINGPDIKNPNMNSLQINNNISIKQNLKKKDKSIDEMFLVSEELVRKLKFYDLDKERLINKPNQIKSQNDKKFVPEFNKNKSSIGDSFENNFETYSSNSHVIGLFQRYISCKQNVEDSSLLGFAYILTT